ncbi:PIN domain-containing protein [Parafilimonas terrae]|uniref:Predicted nucleic acid-binding protein, contains PIN domain n=1 Tax=Parafilimonas terrae TaxID=1465490 RepID=A0A1I5XBC1_9BACT|nr:PIN domain-containing protein [Parafilimonas terrae]SFQ29221.1 Predicted nucleic acid-binding protein, contains PIN domain [Parafilimonas terrae]
MKIVVDTNILISIFIKPDGRIADLFDSLKFHASLYISDYSLIEIANHTTKILKLSKLRKDEFEEIKFNVYKNINVINTDIVPDPFLISAFELRKNIDEFDAPIVGLALSLKAILWTGDKRLLKGLQKTFPDLIYNSSQLRELLQL